MTNTTTGPLVQPTGNCRPERSVVTGPTWWAALRATYLGAWADGPLAEDEGYTADDFLADDPHCTPAQLEVLAPSLRASVRRSVAINLNTPTGILNWLASDGEAGVRAAVAPRHEIIGDVLEELSKDRDGIVRGATARNPNLGTDQAARIARGTWREKYFLAGNPHCPVELLEELYPQNLQAQVLSHPDCPTRLAETLLADYIRQEAPVEDAWLAALAGSPTCRDEWFVPLLTNRIAANAAAENPHCPVGILQTLFFEQEHLRVILAKNPALPGDLVADIIDAQNEGEILALAFANPDTDVLATIVEQYSGMGQVARAVALNPHTSQDTLGVLALHPAMDVRQAVCEHARASWEMLAHQPVGDLRRSASLNTAVLPELEADHAETVIALGASTDLQFSELVDAAHMLVN